MPTLAVAVDARKAKIGSEEARKAIKKVRDETTRLDNAQKRLGAQMSLTGAAAKKAGLGIAGIFGGLTAATALTKTIRVMSSFDEAMARLQGVTGRTEAQMASLENTARKLGATTSFSASEAADGMLMLARAGMSATEVIASTAPVLDLAKVAGVGLEQSATLIADSLKQFGLEATEATMAADQLTMASNRTNTSIEQLGEGLKMAGPIAASAGMSLSDTAAMLGVLADAGLKASLGGTGVRAVLASLSQPSTAAASALQRLGVDLDTLGERILTKGGLLSVMEQLGPETMGMADAITIFSRRGAAAALTLGAQTRRWAKLTKQIEEANGTTRDSAALIEDTLGDSFKSLVSATEEAMLVLGDGGFSGIVQDVVRFLTEGIRGLTDFSNGLTKTSAQAALVVGTLGAAGLAGAVTKIVTAFNAARVAAGGFLAVISAHPIMAAATAIIALGTAAIQFANDAEFATKEMVEFNRVMDDMVDGLDDVSNSMKHAILVGDVRQQIQAIQGLKTQVELLSKSTMALGPTMQFDPKAFDDIRQAFVEMGLPEFFRTSPRGKPFANFPPAMAEDIQTRRIPAQRQIGTAGTPMGIIQEARPERIEETPFVSAKEVQGQVVGALMILDEQMAKLRDSLSMTADVSQKTVDKVADEVDVRAALVNMHQMLTEELEVERLELQKGQRVRDAFVDQLSVLKDLEKATKLSREELLGTYGEELEVLRQLMVKREKLTEKQKQEKALEEAQDEFGTTVASGLVTPLRDALLAGDFRQVGQTMYMNLVAAFLEELAVKPLIQALKPLFAGFAAAPTAANGMALSGGVQRFARGGVVQSATAFGMAGGRMGVMGEAGPEAIMPLKRLPSGRLGIEAQGGGTTINDNRRITIQVHDDAGFRRTMRQLDRDQARRLDKGMK